MAAQITTYAGLKAGMLAWLARTGDALLDARFDDFLLNCERRLYYGYATNQPDNPLRSEPLRILEMQTVNTVFTLQAIVAQPSGFLELISAQINSPGGSPLAPLQIVNQVTLDAYTGRALGGPCLIAVSGSTLRVKDDPAGAMATLRYYGKLATPVGSTSNDILTSYPDVYLYGCLIEAAIFTQDQQAAIGYAQLYNSSIAGLNARTLSATGSASPVVRSAIGPRP